MVSPILPALDNENSPEDNLFTCTFGVVNGCYPEHQPQVATLTWITNIHPGLICVAPTTQTPCSDCFRMKIHFICLTCSNEWTVGGKIFGLGVVDKGGSAHTNTSSSQTFITDKNTYLDRTLFRFGFPHPSRDRCKTHQVHQHHHPPNCTRS